MDIYSTKSKQNARPGSRRTGAMIMVVNTENGLICFLRVPSGGAMHSRANTMRIQFFNSYSGDLSF